MLNATTKTLAVVQLSFLVRHLSCTSQESRCERWCENDPHLWSHKCAWGDAQGPCIGCKWCRKLQFDAFATTPPTANLIFIKLSKTGGSTVGGVIRRIGWRLGLNGVFRETGMFALGKQAEPGLWARHSFRSKLEGQKGDFQSLQLPSFFLSFVRQPVARVLSAFYHFNATRNHDKPTATNIIAFLSTGRQDDYQSHALVPAGIGEDTINQYPNKTLDAIIEAYNFIGITERY